MDVQTCFVKSIAGNRKSVFAKTATVLNANTVIFSQLESNFKMSTAAVHDDNLRCSTSSTLFFFPQITQISTAGKIHIFTIAQKNMKLIYLAVFHPPSRLGGSGVWSLFSTA